MSYIPNRPFGSRKATVNWCDVPVTSVQALLAPSSFGHSLRCGPINSNNHYAHVYMATIPGTWCLCTSRARWQTQAPTHTTSRSVRALQHTTHWCQCPGQATTVQCTWRMVLHGLQTHWLHSKHALRGSSAPSVDVYHFCVVKRLFCW